MRTRVDNHALPGVTAQRTMTMGTELRRDEVFRDGVYVGEVVYVARRRRAGTHYGWRPAKAAAQSRLDTRVDAIRRLPAMVT